MSAERMQQLKAMLAEEPADVFLRYALALEKARSGDRAGAIGDLEGLVRSDPKHIATYYQLAQLLAAAGRNADAGEACKAGMLQCLVQGERRTHRELQELLNTLQDEA